MPLFRYKAMTEEGKNVRGVIDADSSLLAKERLDKQKLMVIDLSLAKDDHKEIRLNSKMLLAFTRELGQLLRAGLPLYESLLTIEEKYRRHPMHPLFLDLCDHLKGGSLLSQALTKYPKTFNSIYLAMISTGETSGSLSSSLEELSLILSREQKLKKQLTSALLYPSFLLFFCCFVIFAFLFFVIPSMKELFEGRALHPLTSIVLGISTWVNQNTLLFFSSLSSFLLFSIFFFRSKKGKNTWEKQTLKIPLLKTLVSQAALVRFCRANAALLRGGLPLLESLALSKKVIKHGLIENVIDNAERRIKEGEKLSMILRSSPLIPPLISRMLAIGEETGKMSSMLSDAAEIYDEDLERSLAQITAFLQPVLLLILGAVVGLIVLSILIPLTDVSSMIGGT